MNKQIVQPVTGYLVNIVDDKLQEGNFGVAVYVGYLTDYNVLLIKIQRWYEDELMDFSIRRSLYVEYWSDALDVADHIKRVSFDDYKVTEESELTELINGIIAAQTQGE